MSLSVARDQGSIVTLLQTSAAASALAPAQAAPQKSAAQTPAPEIADPRGIAELSRVLSAFLTQLNEGSSANAAAGEVANAYASNVGGTSAAGPASAPTAPAPDPIDALKGDFDTLVYSMRSASTQSASPSSLYMRPAEDPRRTAEQLKSDVAGFVSGLTKLADQITGSLLETQAPPKPENTGSLVSLASASTQTVKAQPAPPPPGGSGDAGADRSLLAHMSAKLHRHFDEL